MSVNASDGRIAHIAAVVSDLRPVSKHRMKAGACGKSGKNGYVDSGPEHNEIKSAFVAFVKQNSLEEIRRHQEQCNVRYNDDCHDCGDRYLLLQKLSQLSRLSQVRPAGYSDLVPSRLDQGHRS